MSFSPKVEGGSSGPSEAKEFPGEPHRFSKPTPSDREAQRAPSSR